MKKELDIKILSELIGKKVIHAHLGDPYLGFADTIMMLCGVEHEGSTYSFESISYGEYISYQRKARSKKLNDLLD